MLTLEDKPRRRLKSLLDFSIIRYWWDTWSKANSHGIGWILYINIDKFKRTLLNCLFHLFLTGNLNSEPALWRETSRNHKCQQPRRDLCPRFQRIGTIIHVKRRRPQRAKKRSSSSTKEAEVSGLVVAIGSPQTLGTCWQVWNLFLEGHSIGIDFTRWC